MAEEETVLESLRGDIESIVQGFGLTHNSKMLKGFAFYAVPTGTEMSPMTPMDLSLPIVKRLQRMLMT